MRSSEKFWFPNIIDLLTHVTIFPSQTQSLGAKLNSVMRLTLLIFIVLMFVNYAWALCFLLAAILMNLVFYYGYRSKYE